MSLKEQQNFLARLYTDNNLRRAFLSEPGKIGQENELTEDEISELAAVLPEELNFFAESLFWKRLREVEKFLPLTKQILEENFARYFRDFSQNFNPQSIKKHLEDAIEFAKFLTAAEISDLAKTAAKFEKSRLEFISSEKRFVICKLDFDIRKLHENSALNLQRKTKFAVWIRVGNQIRHFVI